MKALILQHPALVALGVFFIYSNAVQALPAPDEKSTKFYRWAFAFGHGLAGNIKYALQKAMPNYVAPDQPKP